jgi:hypothetical protein
MSSLIQSVLGTTAGKGGLAGIAVSVGMFFVKNILGKKGVNTNIKFLLESLLSSKTKNRPLPEEALRQAKAIEQIFDDQRIFPNRIAIDGTPGSGKSTLAYALAQRLDMEAICLDHQDMDEQLSFAQAPAIYEHHRLLRTQDVERFDVIIYLDQPVEISTKNILHRQRGAYLVDIMNFDLLKKLGAKAFSLADGPEISLENSFVRIKIRPDSGFNAMGNLVSELHNKGFNDSTIKGLNKEQQIFLLEEGHEKKGFMAYVDPRAYEQEFLSALADGVNVNSKSGKRRT